MSRRVAREKALQVLYEVEMGGSDIQEAFENSNGELNLDPHSRKFAQVIASGTWVQREEIDRLIGKYTRRWKIERLAAIDRNILRLAVFEMTTQPDIPHEVSINEAVELAKKYSTDKAASFVNAILDGISKEIRL
ncbi:MAG: transcription antitermination factor NusB [Bacillota bacterium]